MSASVRRQDDPDYPVVLGVDLSDGRFFGTLQLSYADAERLAREILEIVTE